MPDDHFVADGRERAVEACKCRIRRKIEQAVEAKYAASFEGAGLLRRTLLRFRMSREISKQVKAEIEKIAPRNGLYLANQDRQPDA